jgi:hypothetical protein
VVARLTPRAYAASLPQPRRFAGKVNASFDRLMIRYQEVTSGTQPRIGVTDSSQLAGPVKRRTDAAQNDSECRIIRNCYGRPLGVKTIAPVESTELLHFHGEPGVAFLSIFLAPPAHASQSRFWKAGSQEGRCDDA